MEENLSIVKKSSDKNGVVKIFPKTSKNNHAVIIGGSIAGLLAAAVLTKHFTKVTLLDGDELKHDIDARKATPQGNHVHGLLNSGWEAVKVLFPDIEPELMALGANCVHFGNEFRWHHFGKVKAQFDEPMRGPFMSRSCLEETLYNRVKTFENLEIIQQCKVKKIIGTAEKIDGVITENGEEILADFVLDASGRRSKVTESLEEIGMNITKGVLPAGLRYTSARFAPRADFKSSWKALFVTPKPPISKAAAIFPVANGEWIVTVSGRGKDVMPTTLEEFLKYTDQLSTPEVSEALEGAEIQSNLHHFRYKESRRYYFENVEMPKNLVVLGDALCSVNPIFGQGMTLCAMEALALDKFLSEGDFDSNDYYKEVVKVVNVAWEMIKVEDMRHAHLYDNVPLKVKMMQWFTAKIYDKAGMCPELNKKFYEVIHFTRPPSDLRKLSVLLKVLR